MFVPAATASTGTCVYAGIGVFGFEMSSQVLLGFELALVAGITTTSPRRTTVHPVLGLDMLAGIGHTVRTAKIATNVMMMIHTAGLQRCE